MNENSHSRAANEALNGSWNDIVDWVEEHGGSMSQEQRIELRTLVGRFATAVAIVASDD
jgi:hypothetical protein